MAHIKQLIEESYPKGRGVIMTLAEILRKEGKVQGKVQGKEEGKKEVAKKLIAKSYPFKVIAEVTGLKEWELEQLSKETRK